MLNIKIKIKIALNNKEIYNTICTIVKAIRMKFVSTRGKRKSLFSKSGLLFCPVRFKLIYVKEYIVCLSWSMWKGIDLFL